MPRYLTAEWVSAFNGALAGTRLPGPGPEAGLAAADGRFTVVEEVRGGPDGDVRLVLVADDGALTLALAAPGGEPVDPDVTVALDYADAVALARGELSPAEALTAGRIRVRGDLSVLVAGQQLLEAARQHTADVDTDTEF